MKKQKRIKISDINKDDLRYLATERCLSNVVIGKMFNCSSDFIRKCLNYYGIKKDISAVYKRQFQKGRKVNCKIYDIPPKEDLEYLYIERKLSLNKIKDIFNVSINLVKKWMIKYNIPFRTRSECIINAYNTGVLTSSYSDPIFQEELSKRRKKYNKSKAEYEIIEFISQYYTGEIIHSYNIGTKSFDIYIPELNVIIEYNGLYWHSFEYIKDKNYHKDKTILCANNNIRLIHIWEDQWQFDKEKTKLWLLGILNLSNKKRVYGRNTIVKLISKPLLLKDFFNKYHIQGYTSSSVGVGLYYEDVLISAVLFKKDGKGGWSLVRYTSIPDYNIIGGFGKLLKCFIKSYGDNIYTFADLSWVSTKDNVYLRNGFVEDKILEPDYKYIVNKKRVHKFNFRHKGMKSKLPSYDPNLSEWANMEKAGIRRIYDCGKVRYVFKSN